jgi:CBS domain-containing protein
MSTKRRVEDVMTTPVIAVRPGCPAEEARRLPVVDGDGRLTAIVSRRELLAALMPDDREIRRRVTDRVIDVGGDVYAVCVAHGSLVVRGRIGNRSEIAVVERILRKIPGIDRVTLDFEYETDDTAGSVPVTRA